MALACGCASHSVFWIALFSIFTAESVSSFQVHLAKNHPTRRSGISKFSSSILSLKSSVHFIDDINNHEKISDSGSRVPFGRRIFQLESQEGPDSFLTEIMLNPDGTVEIGQSEGPEFCHSFGFWEEEQPQQSQEDAVAKDTGFAMSITMEFEGGSIPSGDERIDKFRYSVERIYTGEWALVGAQQAVVGSILYRDEELGDAHVGYFQMIETTSELENDQQRCQELVFETSKKKKRTDIQKGKE